MQRTGSRPGRAVLTAHGVGGLLGLAIGLACWGLGVGGRGPESGMWVILMPLVGLGQGLLAGLAGLATARLARDAPRVAAVLLATVGLSYGVGRTLLEGFDLAGVESLQAAALGLATGLLWPRWSAAPGARRRAVHGSRTATLGIALGLSVAAVGCGEGSGGGAAPAPETSVVGRWVSDPSPSQLGTVVHTYEFAADGTFRMSMEFLQARIPKMEMRGTYDPAQRTLRTGDGGGGGRMTWSFEGDVLVLSEGRDTYRLRRR